MTSMTQPAAQRTIHDPAGLITWRRTGFLAYSVWFYLADIAMVAIDICLYFRNVRLDRERDAAKQ